MFKRSTRAFDKHFDDPLHFRVGMSIAPVAEGKDPIRISKVFYKTADYVIFELEGSKPPSVDYYTLNDEKFNTQAISVQLARVNAILENSGAVEDSSSALRDTYEEAIADAISLSFQGKTDQAVQRMIVLETEVKNEVFKYSKVLYLFPSMIVEAVFGMLAAWGHYTHFRIAGLNLGFDDAEAASLSRVTVLAALAGLGAIVSMANGIDQRHIEIKWKGSYARSLYRPVIHPALYGGLLRVFVAIVGALVVFCFFKSHFISVKGLDAVDNDYAIYLIAFISGFSEKLIPSLLTQFETRLVSSETIRMPTGSSPALGNAVAESGQTGGPAHLHIQQTGPQKPAEAYTPPHTGDPSYNDGEHADY